MKIRFQGQLDSIQWDTISTGTNLYEVSDFSEKYWEVVCYLFPIQFIFMECYTTLIRYTN